MALEIGELKALDFDLSLTGFDPVEIDGLLFGEQKEDVPDPAAPELLATSDHALG